MKLPSFISNLLTKKAPPARIPELTLEDILKQEGLILIPYQSILQTSIRTRKTLLGTDKPTEEVKKVKLKITFSEHNEVQLVGIPIIGTIIGDFILFPTGKYFIIRKRNVYDMPFKYYLAKKTDSTPGPLS